MFKLKPASFTALVVTALLFVIYSPAGADCGLISHPTMCLCWTLHLTAGCFRGWPPSSIMVVQGLRLKGCVPACLPSLFRLPLINPSGGRDSEHRVLRLIPYHESA